MRQLFAPALIVANSTTGMLLHWFALLAAVLASCLAGSDAFVPSAAVPQAFSPLSAPTATSVTLKWLPPVWGGGEQCSLALRN